MAEHEEALARALQCLAPVCERLVVVGGAAHRLFPLHELASAPGFELLTTEDVDFVTPLDLAYDGSPELVDRLAQAGFREEVGGASYAAHRYRLPGGNAPYLQFLAPRRGSGITRSGERDRRLRFSGITAEKLPHVDVLLHEPWSLELPDDAGEARVANPVAFLVQKGLIMEARSPAKRGKDVLYIYDTLALFAGSFDALAVSATRLVPRLSRKARTRLRRNLEAHCFRGCDATIEAALIARNQRLRPPTANLIAVACRSGLTGILAPLDLGFE